MLIKKTVKHSFIIPVSIFIVLFYITLRVMTAIGQNNGTFEIEILNNVINQIYRLDTILVITAKTIGTSFFMAIFGLMVYETIRLQNRKNVQENTHGSAEWCNPKDIEEKRDKTFENNTILSETEFVSKNMKISKMNRHVILVGRPGTRKIKILF